MKILSRISFFKKHKSKLRGKNPPHRQSTLFDNERSSSFFQKRRKQSIIDLKKYIIFLKEQKLALSICGIIFSLFLGAFLIYGPVFGIQEIYIEDEKNISNINQAYDSIEYARGENILFIDVKKLSDRITKNQATIKDIRVYINFPNTLEISIISHNPIFQTEKYTIYENGSVALTQTATSDTPLLQVALDLEEYAIFGRTLKADNLRDILLLLENIEKNILGFSARTLYYLPIEKELIIENGIGTLFIFDLSENISNQIEKIAVYMKESEDITQKKYIYIDVRIPQKLFLCGFENEFLCNTNMQNIYGKDIFTKFLEETSEPEQ